jgi:hypothetical protein
VLWLALSCTGALPTSQRPIQTQVTPDSSHSLILPSTNFYGLIPVDHSYDLRITAINQETSNSSLQRYDSTAIFRTLLIRMVPVGASHAATIFFRLTDSLALDSVLSPSVSLNSFQLDSLGFALLSPSQNPLPHSCSASTIREPLLLARILSSHARFIITERKGIRDTVSVSTCLAQVSIRSNVELHLHNHDPTRIPLETDESIQITMSGNVSADSSNVLLLHMDGIVSGSGIMWLHQSSVYVFPDSLRLQLHIALTAFNNVQQQTYSQQLYYSLHTKH